MSNEPEDIEDFIPESSKTPKDPKGSARGKYNRRKVWLAHALHEMDLAIDHLLSQPGSVYKRQEIDTLKAAIATFIETTGVKPPELEPLTQEQMDGFMEMLENLEPWQPPSKDELAELYALLDKEAPLDEEEGETEAVNSDLGHSC